jgi:hypothetical protein
MMVSHLTTKSSHQKVTAQDFWLVLTGHKDALGNTQSKGCGLVLVGPKDAEHCIHDIQMLIMPPGTAKHFPQ